MDSFLGAPRQPPTLPTINTMERAPLVPEVSLIDNSFPRKPVDYNTMRPPQNMNTLLHKDSFINLKKQVRFQGHQSQPVFGKENMPQTLKAVPDLNGKTFKQIYMANVPDRHLDLSIFEPSRQDNRRVEKTCDVRRDCDDSFLEPPRHTLEASRSEEINHDFTRKRFDSISSYKAPTVPSATCNRQFNDSTLRNIDNVSYNSNWRQKERHLYNKNSHEDIAFEKKSHCTEICTQTALEKKLRCTEICTQTDPPPISKECTDIATPTDQPTLKDLYRLIQLQNEQILQLQQQVTSLKTSIRQPEIDSVPHETCPEYSPSKKKLFSFGVKATSVVFHTQQHKFRKNDFLEPKIQEVACDSTADNQTDSLRLDGSVEVKDGYVSNVQSIAIEMNEYQGSDDDETGSDEEVGLTLYHDLMNQVNNALKNAQKNSECQAMHGNNRQAMNVVRQATLQHLNNIGVNLSPIQESSEVTGSSNIDVESCDQSDVSCAVQQLLMKYLPSDKLAKVLKRNEHKQPERQGKPSNTDFSFATLQYMKKYNLLDNTKNVDIRKKAEAGPKILDVTALKMQRKLL